MKNYLTRRAHHREAHIWYVSCWPWLIDRPKIKVPSFVVVYGGPNTEDDFTDCFDKFRVVLLKKRISSQDVKCFKWQQTAGLFARLNTEDQSTWCERHPGNERQSCHQKPSWTLGLPTCVDIAHSWFKMTRQRIKKLLHLYLFQILFQVCRGVMLPRLFGSFSDAIRLEVWIFREDQSTRTLFLRMERGTTSHRVPKDGSFDQRLSC